MAVMSRPRKWIVAAGGVEHAGQGLEGAGLAGAVGAHQGDQFAFVDVEGDAAHRLDAAVGSNHRKAGHGNGTSQIGFDDAAVLFHGGHVFGDFFAVVENRHPVAQAHDELDVVFDQKNGRAVAADAFDERAAALRFRWRSCRRPARRGRGAGVRRPGRGRSPDGAGRRRKGSWRGRRRGRRCRRKWRSSAARRRIAALFSAGTRASRNMAPKTPAPVRTWRPTMTFSTADMLPNRRMFWKVRAIPRSAAW